jgi:hypothetical protein
MRFAFVANPGDCLRGAQLVHGANARGCLAPHQEAAQDHECADMGRERDRARSLEPVEPHQRPIRMKNAIYKVWNRVSDWIDAAIEFYDWWIDKPERNNRFAKLDVIQPLPKKANLQ